MKKPNIKLDKEAVIQIGGALLMGALGAAKFIGDRAKEKEYKDLIKTVEELKKS